MINPRTRETVVYVSEQVIDGERAVAMRSPSNPRRLRFVYSEHRIWPDSDDHDDEEEEDKEKEEEKD